jgi:hypothetical protein
MFDVASIELQLGVSSVVVSDTVGARGKHRSRVDIACFATFIN